MTKVVFFGSSKYSLIILQELIGLTDFPVISVVTKSDKPTGRTQEITPNPVAQFALDHHLPLLSIDTFDDNQKLKIKNFQAQLGLCIAFGPPFFDQEMIDAFPLGIINIHPSPLPKYRGATPGPWQIINGESISAVTFFQIDTLPDHGPIIAQIPFDISSTDTADTFYQKAFTLAATNLDTILNSYIINHNSLPTQDHTQKSYYPKLNKDMAKIDWSWDNLKINRFVRAMQPWPTAWTKVKDQNNNVLKMKIYSFNTEPFDVQIEGKKPTRWTEIAKYYSLVN